MRRLGAYYESLDACPRVQIGRFPEAISLEDTWLVVDIVLDGVDPPQSVLATECPASRADGLLREIAAVRDVRAVSDVRSTRSARSPDQGTG
jgi:hypothetical protein